MDWDNWEQVEAEMQQIEWENEQCEMLRREYEHMTGSEAPMLPYRELCHLVQFERRRNKEAFISMFKK